MALNLSVENVVDSENGYWAELTLEPAKKASPPQNIKKARSPLKEKTENNTFERVKSADAKRSSLLGEKVQKTKEHNQKVEEVHKESKEQFNKRIEGINTNLAEKIKKAEQIHNEKLEEKKRKASKSIDNSKKLDVRKKFESAWQSKQEKLEKAEEHRKEQERQIRLNNEQKHQRFLANKEKNIKATPQDCS